MKGNVSEFSFCYWAGMKQDNKIISLFSVSIYIIIGISDEGKGLKYH